MKRNLFLIMALFASVCGWAEEPKQVAPVDNTTIVPVTPGDVNGDGSVDVFDLQALFQYLKDGTTPENWKEKNADYDGNTEIDVFDLQALFDDLKKV